MYEYFLSKLEVIKLFRCNKYRSTLFNKITIKDMEREREREDKSEKRVIIFKSFKDKIVIKWKEIGCEFYRATFSLFYCFYFWEKQLPICL